MQLIDLLNQLEEKGQLGKLYQAGALNIKCFNHKEIVLHYRALLAMPGYVDQPTRAAEATAMALGVDVSTVYRARREMERAV
jgi:hypothetical protein